MENNNNNHSLHRITADQHNIDDNKICDQARLIVNKLVAAGYEAYLVGGCVRDLLLGIQPKDFDVATNAHPNEICGLFNNSRLIGRRFQIVHIYFGRDYIEVSTFRAKASTSESTKQNNGRILRDNTFGNIEEDAIRRDFTINAMYYDIKHSQVLDFCNGWKDLADRKICMIGDAETRYKEDPVRMLRALRFRSKLNLTIDDKTQTPIRSLGHLLKDIPPARLFDEIIKLFHSGFAINCYHALHEFNLFKILFPITNDALNHDEQFSLLIHAALENTDSRIQANKSVNPAFIFAILLWRPYLQLLDQFNKEGIPFSEGAWAAGRNTVLDQSSVTTIPKRFSITICEIWKLQNRFTKISGKKTLRLLSHPRFRAAYDFMCLRVHSGEVEQDSCDWWTKIQTVSAKEQHKMTQHHPKQRRIKSNNND